MDQNCQLCQIRERLNPMNQRSHMLFDTAGLEKFRLAEIRAAERAAELKTRVM